jgi:hypothetical protein
VVASLPVSVGGDTTLISQRVLMSLFCESQSLHESVNSSFVSVTIKEKFTDLCGKCLLQNDFAKKICGINSDLKPESLISIGCAECNLPGN